MNESPGRERSGFFLVMVLTEFNRFLYFLSIPLHIVKQMPLFRQEYAYIVTTGIIRLRTFLDKILQKNLRHECHNYVSLMPVI